jgi:hypothetical protein
VSPAEEKLRETALNIYNMAKMGGLDEDKCLKLYTETLKQGRKQQRPTASSTASTAAALPKRAIGIFAPSVTDSVPTSKGFPFQASSSSSSSLLKAKGGGTSTTSKSTQSSKAKSSSSHSKAKSGGGGGGVSMSAATFSSSSADAANTTPIEKDWMSGKFEKPPTYREPKFVGGTSSTPIASVALSTPSPFLHSSSSSSSSSSLLGQGRQHHQHQTPVVEHMVQQSLTSYLFKKTDLSKG